MNDDDEQIEHWNGEAGHRWARAQPRMDALLAPLTHAAIERTDPRPGERVLDVGCGCGDSSLALAARGAEVLGVDVSGPMLQRARERGTELSAVRFEQANAATHPFDGESVDLLFSRLGVMFFADPVQAFINLRRVLVPGGRACLVCWQGPEHNPWLTVPLEALRPFAPEATMPTVGVPGPFAFAEPGRLAAILDAAGFIDVESEPIHVSLGYGVGLDQAMALAVEVGVASRILATLGSEAQQEARQALREALGRTLTPTGVELGAGAFVVTARTPGD